STPAGLRAPDHYGGAARPLGSQKQGLPREVFRRSIAWLSGSLSTLRGAGYPRPAQDSLPAAGQALLDGLSTRRVPMRGFGGATTSRPPLPSLPGAMGSTDAPSKSARGSMPSAPREPTAANAVGLSRHELDPRVAAASPQRLAGPAVRNLRHQLIASGPRGLDRPGPILAEIQPIANELGDLAEVVATRP